MCATCGCGATEHEHHDHHHHHHPRTIPLEQKLLAKNDRIAAQNRAWLGERGVYAVNLMGTPGAGKTTLLERVIAALGALPITVVEGDQETDRDAERIRATGCAVQQINTGTGCHLDAEMLADALHVLVPPPHSLLFIENVGNLVCPALFDLGERTRVVVLSVTEGDDKPLKYPHMFRTADVLVLGKMDLLPHVDFDVDRCLADARKVNPRLRVFPVSARRGDGVVELCEFVRAQVPV